MPNLPLWRCLGLISVACIAFIFGFGRLEPGRRRLAASSQDPPEDISTNGACSAEIKGLCTDVWFGSGRIADCLRLNLKKGIIGGNHQLASDCRRELYAYLLSSLSTDFEGDAEAPREQKQKPQHAEVPVVETSTALSIMRMAPNSRNPTFIAMLESSSQKSHCQAAVNQTPTSLCITTKVRETVPRGDPAIDRKCENDEINGAPPSAYTMLVKPALELVTKAAKSITREHFWKWSEATDPTVVYGQLQAINTAVASFPSAEALDYLEIGSNWGTSMAIVGQLMRQKGLRPGRMVSIDPYGSYGGLPPRPGESSEYYDVAQEVRRLLRALPPHLVTADEQRHLDLGGLTPHQVSAYALYRSLGFVVEHIRENSDKGLELLIQEGARFHVAYIDGLHTADAVLSDTAAVMSLLHSGGAMIEDDVMGGFALELNRVMREHFGRWLVHSTWKTDVYKVCAPGY